MAAARLLKKVHNLSDIELAALLCLIARGHCLISTPADSLDDLIAELQLVASRTFGLQSVVVDCTPQTTLDEFATALLLPQSPPTTPTAATERKQPTTAYSSPRNDSYFPPQPTPTAGTSVASPRAPSSHAHGHAAAGRASTSLGITNVILARNLDRAPKAVQIQALDLLRTRRIFTRTAVHAAPKQFLFVAVVAASAAGEAHLTRHLNDFLFLSHWHDPEASFANLDDEQWDGHDDGASSISSTTRRDREEEEDVEHRGKGGRRGGDDTASLASTTSIIKKRNRTNRTDANPTSAVLHDADIAELAALADRARTDIAVLRYQMNVIAFLRLHRAVAGGISPLATRHLALLARCLAPLHGLDFVTPALVALAVPKVYLHRIAIVPAPERERSMQWGSERAAVEVLLEGVGPEDVVEDVLGLVAAPV